MILGSVVLHVLHAWTPYAGAATPRFEGLVLEVLWACPKLWYLPIMSHGLAGDLGQKH